MKARLSGSADEGLDDLGLSADEVFDLERVYRVHAPRVARFAARLAGPGFDVDDIVHDVFLVVQRRLPEFRGAPTQIPTWLYAITANVVRAKRRSDRWRRWLTGSAAETGADLPAPDPDPAGALEGRRTIQDIYRALDGLDEKYRMVLIMFELEGLSGEQIAAALGKNTSTVWVWLHRARDAFVKRARALGLEGRL